jgi:hypothetical protein
MRNLNSIVAAAIIGVASATKAVDFSTLLTESSFQCMKENGISLALPRAWRSYGAFDSNSLPNIKNAHAAGIEAVDVYAFPCRGASASDQMTELIN